MKDFQLFIPKNKVIRANGYFDWNGLVELLRKYKNKPKAVQFIADMME